MPSALDKLDTGWYVAIGIVSTIALSSTPLSPFMAGIMGVAIIFQLNHILGKDQ